MKILTNESEQRFERYQTECRSAGIKLTHQRLEIFRELANSNEHPDAETIYRAVKTRIPTISLDTVYRTLWTLWDLGLITTLGAPRERMRFDTNIDTHHHFVCSECGLIHDFADADFDRLKLPEALKALGDIEQTHVEVRGLCKQCAIKKGSGFKSKK